MSSVIKFPYIQKRDFSSAFHFMQSLYLPVQDVVLFVLVVLFCFVLDGLFACFPQRKELHRSQCSFAAKEPEWSSVPHNLSYFRFLMWP